MLVTLVMRSEPLEVLLSRRCSSLHPLLTSSFEIPAWPFLFLTSRVWPPILTSMRFSNKQLTVWHWKRGARGRGVLNIGRLGPGGENYYLTHVASGAEDYYLDRGEAPGRWIGRGAELLGLEGRVEPSPCGRC